MSKAMLEMLLTGAIWLIGAVAYFMIFDETPIDAQGLRRGAEGGRDVSEDREHFLDHEGLRRRYLVHVPKGYDTTRRFPVVLAFHGGMGTAEGFRTQSRLDEAADRFGFVVVYPEGTGPGPRLLTWNAGSCCGSAVRQKVDDVGFVRKLLGELPRLYAVDSKRVYATGMSNGAMLCYRLACELSDRITAIGPVSGDMGVDGPTPKRPVPVIHFHGRQDPNILYQGGVGPNQFQPVPHRSIPETIEWWVKADRCRPDPVEVVKGRDYVKTRNAPEPGKPGAPVVLYELPEGGHTWPGGVDVSARLNTGKLITSVDANAIMWQFFEQFRLDDPAEAPAK